MFAKLLVMEREYCQQCGRTRRPAEWTCPRCSCPIYGPSAVRGQASHPQALCGELSALRGLEPGEALVLYGAKGSGKTSVALRAFARPLVITTEMSASRLFEYGERLGVHVVEVIELRLSDEGAPELPEWEGEADGLVLDSLNGRGDVVAVWQLVEAFAGDHGLPLVVVAQTTTDGGVRGGEYVPHACTVLAEVRREGDAREIVVEKDRHGSDVDVIPFTLGTTSPPPHFFTVEGKPGRYQLVAYPWGASEVWEAAERGKLKPPAPPVAAAARFSKLHGGWVEPPDHQAREAFCAARGIPYWRPHVDTD